MVVKLKEKSPTDFTQEEALLFCGTIPVKLAASPGKWTCSAYHAQQDAASNTWLRADEMNDVKELLELIVL